VKKIRGDKLVGVVIHICMDTTQRTPLCSYAYLKLAKMSCFSFYLLPFFFYKSREEEGGTGRGATGTMKGGRR
jgi:hypothetical protein